MTAFVTVDANATDPRPRNAARRPARPPDNAIEPAATIHNREWFADRDNAGNARFAHGTWCCANHANAAWSTACTRPSTPGRAPSCANAAATRSPNTRPCDPAPVPVTGPHPPPHPHPCP
ncbi:hypothetical protein ACU686_35000 [Yinghuangia aomiensis]